MGKFVAEQTIKQLIATGSPVKGADVVVLGMTFKENCPDLRNSKVIDVVRELRSFGVKVHVHDPIASSEECEHEYGIHLTPWSDLPVARAIVAAVSHSEYARMGLRRLCEKLSPGGVFADVKSMYDPQDVSQMGFVGWRL